MKMPEALWRNEIKTKAIVQFDLVWFVVKKKLFQNIFIFLIFPTPLLFQLPINNISKKLQPHFIPTPTNPSSQFEIIWYSRLITRRTNWDIKDNLIVVQTIMKTKKHFLQKQKTFFLKILTKMFLWKISQRSN